MFMFMFTSMYIVSEEKTGVKFHVCVHILNKADSDSDEDTNKGSIFPGTLTCKMFLLFLLLFSFITNFCLFILFCIFAFHFTH